MNNYALHYTLHKITTFTYVKCTKYSDTLHYAVKDLARLVPESRLSRLFIFDITLCKQSMYALISSCSVWMHTRV